MHSETIEAMPHYNINWAHPDGTREMRSVEGRRFSHCVNCIQFWFLVHRVDHSAAARVTHIASGMWVIDIPHAMLASKVSMSIPSIAREEIDKLVAQKGAALVAKALTKAEKAK